MPARDLAINTVRALPDRTMLQDHLAPCERAAADMAFQINWSAPALADLESLIADDALHPATVGRIVRDST